MSYMQMSCTFNFNCSVGSNPTGGAIGGSPGVGAPILFSGSTGGVPAGTTFPMISAGAGAPTSITFTLPLGAMSAGGSVPTMPGVVSGYAPYGATVMPGVAGGYAPYGATGVIPGYSYGVTPGVGFGAAPTVGITGMPAIGVPGVVTPGITGTPGFGMGGGLPANNPYGLPEGFNPAWLQDPSLQQYFRPLSEQIPRNRWIYSANGILFACEMAKRGVIVPWVR